MRSFHLSDVELRNLYQRTHIIAVPGLSPKPHRPSHGVARVLQQMGKRIVPINPVVAAQQGSILGEPAYASLTDAVRALAAQSDQIDLVDVFRAPAQVPSLIDEMLTLKLPAVWLQMGVIHEAAASKAQQAGMLVDMGRCLKVEWRRVMRPGAAT